MRTGTGRLWITAGLLATAALPGCSALLRAQNAPPAVPPRQWAADAAQHELEVIQYHNVYLRYREHAVDNKGDRIRDVIESKDGPVARTVLKDGRALTPEEDEDERDRLQGVIDSPAAFAKHIKGDANGKKMGADLIRLLPDAMLYTYAPNQPQRADHTGGEPEIVLDFVPNPTWTPPSTASEALTGIEGRAWIDPRTHYMVRMEGTVFRGVNFGLFLAHIFPGGKLAFEQVPATPRRWIFTRFTEHVDVRVLVKTIRENTEIEASQFREVPPMTYQEAVHLLLATPLPAQ